MNDQATGSHPTALGVLENGAEATLPSNYGSIVRAPRNLVSPSPSGQGVVLGPNLGRVATSLGMERSDRWHRMTPLLPVLGLLSSRPVLPSGRKEAATAIVGRCDVRDMSMGDGANVFRVASGECGNRPAILGGFGLYEGLRCAVRKLRQGRERR